MAERKKISARKKMSVAQQENLIDALQAKDAADKDNISTKKVKKKSSEKKQRVTVDFPQAMYERMKEETNVNGQTLRGFVISLVRKHFSELDK